MMRIRTRSLPNPSSPLSRTLLTPTIKDEGLGPRQCLPLIKESMSIIGQSLPRPSISVIEDEGDSSIKQYIKYVKHKKIQYPAFEMLEHFYMWDLSVVWNPYRGPQVWCPNAVRLGHYPGELATDVAEAMTRVDLRVPNPFAAFQQPTSRAGELPAKVIRRVEDIHLTTTLVESRDFPALFKLFTKRGALRALLGTLRNIRRGSPKETVKRLIKEYREGHLGLQFGLMPTMSDVAAISREIRKGIRKRRPEFSVAVRNTLADSQGNGAQNNPYFNKMQVREEMLSTRIDGCHVVINYPPFVSDEYLELENKIDRLIGVNPAGLIWEVLPISFAVDWLLSVDDILDNLFLNMSTRYQCTYWTSVKYEYRRVITFQYCNGISGSLSNWPPSYDWKDGKPLETQASLYERSLGGGPSISDSLRTRGSNVYNVFLSALIALGFRR